MPTPKQPASAHSPLARWISSFAAPRDGRVSSSESEFDIAPTLCDLIALRAESRGLGLGLGSRVATSQAGSYVSAYKGRGIDFEETRLYQAGDDFRTVDWRVTARTGEPHTKIFREERERPVLFLVDQSASMLFGTRGRFKSVTAARAAALLAWAAVDNGDRVGGIIHADHRQLELQATGRKTGVLQLLKCMTVINDATNVEQPTYPANVALTRLGRLARPGTVVFLISDFRDWDEQAARILRQISSRCDLVAIVVHDTIEASAPSPNLYAVSNGLEFAAFDTRNQKIVRNYEKNFTARTDSIARLCRSSNARFLTLNGIEAIAPALRKGLHHGGEHRG